MLQGQLSTSAHQLQRRPQLPLRPLAQRKQVVVSVQSSLQNSHSNKNQPIEPSSLLTNGSALPCSQSVNSIKTPNLPIVPQQDQQLQHQQWELQAAAGDGGSSGGSSGGSGGGGGGGGGGGDDEEDEILDLSQVEAAAAAAKVNLPADMLETAKATGLRASALTAYISLQGHMASGLIKKFSWIRNRMIADDKFLFKVFAEVLIDSGCATVAEVRKRGKDFWAEFEFYLSDLLVGCVLDVVLVSLMAPVAVLGGRAAVAAASQSGLQRWLAGIPSAALEASVKGVREYSVGSRFACLGVKFLEYSLAGITCGFIGQGIANSLMMLKRQIHGEKEDDVAVPPLFRTALVWGLFMGLSSNIRYQAVFGLERLVDMTIAKQVPAVAYGTTVAIRFVNNVVGGENFIDMARWAGVQ